MPPEMPPKLLQSVVSVVPRLRGPIQLAGFAFAIICATLIHGIDKHNTTAVGLVGAIGVAVLAVPQAFHRSVLELLPIAQRALFLLVMLVVLLFSFGAIASITFHAVTATPPAGARFDSRLNVDKFKLVPRPDGTHSAQVSLEFVPLDIRGNEGATIFTGVVAIHDESMVDPQMLQSGRGRLACADVPSCLGARYLADLATTPVFVRPTGTSPFTLIIPVKNRPRQVRVRWDFYQREGIDGAACGFDHSVLAPRDGIPKLAMYARNQKVGDECYRSFGQQLIDIPPEKAS